MTKYITVILLTFFFLQTDAQVYTIKQINNDYKFYKDQPDTTLIIPSVCGFPKLNGFKYKVVYDSCNSKLYYFNKKWIEIKDENVSKRVSLMSCGQ
jgi:hypothetical protein